MHTIFGSTTFCSLTFFFPTASDVTIFPDVFNEKKERRKTKMLSVHHEKKNEDELPSEVYSSVEW